MELRGERVPQMTPCSSLYAAMPGLLPASTPSRTHRGVGSEKTLTYNVLRTIPTAAPRNDADARLKIGQDGGASAMRRAFGNSV